MQKVHAVSTVKIDKGLRTSGCWCYTAYMDGFLTLYVAKNQIQQNQDDVAVVPAKEYLIFDTGQRKTPLQVNISDIESTNPVLVNFPVYSGEETWVHASTPNKFCV